jgi:KamA family protein
MNPHPDGQRELNIPRLNGEPVQGMQHKYRETVLFFPAAGQTCHSYCTYCFRWAQFVGLDKLRFASQRVDQLVQYLRAHPEVTSVLLTGGDPLVMKTSVLRRFVEALLSPELGHVESIRIGTKAPAYWPQRFVSDADADELLRLFERVQRAGRHLTLMAHYSHPRELSTRLAQAAVQRIRSSGAVVRCQTPLIRHVNDSADVWAEMWRRQVRLGAAPYYMFVERDTGPQRYFEVPLARGLDIFNQAYARQSGLGRTARGPSMSATPGKVLVDGVAEIGEEKVFVLKFLQARNPSWVGRTFFAQFDPRATWLDDLRPALGETEFFFERA